MPANSSADTPSAFTSLKKSSDTGPLDKLAARAAERPFFLASALAAYQKRHGLDDAGLCRLLGCPPAALTTLRLCRSLGANGKEICREALWKRLTPGTMVLQQSGALPVAAAFQRVLARDALVLAPRQDGKPTPKYVPVVPPG
jgi:hypothetical protein